MAKRTKKVTDLTEEEAQVLLWQMGVLEWKLRPEQRLLKSEIDKPQYHLVVGNISRRWGKTFTLVTYCIEQALKKKQKIRYGAAFLTDLEEFVIPAFELILEDCPRHLRPEYLSSRKVWKFPNGSEIKLVGLDKNPSGLRGNAINIIVIDEAGFVSNLQYLYTSVIIPATAKQKNIKIVFISTPPPTPSHYFTELIDKAQIQDNGYYLKLTIDDISDLDPEERQRLLDEVGGEHSTTARREFFCEIVVDTERAVIPEFTSAIETVTVKDWQRPKFFDHYSALDVGFHDATAGLFAYLDFEQQKVVIEDELVLTKATTDKIAHAIKAKEVGLYGEKEPHKRVSDNDLRLIADLRAVHELYFRPTEKKDKEKAINKVRMLIANGQIIIHPRCVNLIRQLRSAIWNKARTSFDRDAINSHFDLVDALIYLIRSIDFSKNPVPTNYGLNPETQYISSSETYPSESHRVLHEALFGI